jgi:hypothetical protein
MHVQPFFLFYKLPTICEQAFVNEMNNSCEKFMTLRFFDIMIGADGLVRKPQAKLTCQI